MPPKPATVSPLEAHLGYWLRFVSNQVSHAFGLRLAALGVTTAEWVVMRELYDRADAAPHELAARLGLTRGAISKLVDRLAAKSLIARATQADDRRYQSLALTAKARALVPRLSALADKNDAEFFGHLDAAARAEIKTAMQDVVRRHGLRSVPID
jgi:DNA-binding MarR family transcriptional regulator